jgi:dynein heavy chain
MFHYKGGIYIYGGWNYITSFNIAMKYDIVKEEWQSTNLIDESFFVWNHCALEVEAVPSWKYFVFGGSCGVFDETKSRERAKCHSNIYVGDLDTQALTPVVLDNSNIKPPAVEDSSMIYHKFTKSLVIFGGWNNQWFGDLYSCCVSSIVGPSYSVTALEPNMGRISGSQRVKIYGSKLLGDNFTVYFISGKYKSQTVESISDSEAEFTTPNFNDLGAKDVEVRISINGEELSTNPINFTIYLDTKADKSVYFGPGSLNGVCPGHKTSLMIRAKNELNENRSSGMDEFTCSIVDSVSMENIQPTITDLKNGLYRVEYTPLKAIKYKISIGLKEENVSQNIRGSPIDIMCDGEDPANNNLDGPLMINKFLKENYELIDNQMEKLIADSKTKGKDLSDINTIINIKNSNKTIDIESDKIDCTINQLVEYYKTFELGKTKISKEISIDKLEGMFKTLNQMLEIRESSGNEIAPLIVEQTEKNKTEIQEFTRTLITYGSQIRLREFAQRYDIGPKKAFEEIAKVELEVQERQAKLDVYDKIMKNLNFPDETNSF